MKKFKITAAALALVLSLGLVSCGGKKDDVNDSTSGTTVTTKADENGNTTSGEKGTVTSGTEGIMTSGTGTSDTTAAR